jgi:GAF domain-containing protein/HAMP domain-containing protein
MSEPNARPMEHPDNGMTPSSESVARNMARQRAVNIRRILVILAIVSVISTIFDLIMFFLNPTAWQIPASVGFIVVAFALVPVALSMVHREKLDVAAYLILFGIILVMTGNQLFLSGATVILAMAGVLTIVLVGYASLPQQKIVWLATTGLYLVFVFLIERFEPLPRYAIAQSPPLRTFVPLIVTFLILAALWVVVRTFRGGTLRSRLLASFVGATLLPVIIIGISLLVLGVQRERQQVSSQLESVAILKENEINTWVDDLQSDLALALSSDIVAQQAVTLLQHPTDPSMTQLADTALRSHLDQVLRKTGRFEEFLLLDLLGNVVLATDAVHQGESHGNDLYFRDGLRGLYVQRPYYSASDVQVLQFAAIPVKNALGEVEGVLAGRASLAALNTIMAERAGLGETGETYLVASSTILTPNHEGRQGFYALSPGIDKALVQHISSAGLYDNYAGEPVVGAYRWLPDLQVALLAEQSRAEALDEVYLMLAMLGGIALFAVLVTVVASLFIIRSISNPLTHLAATASRIAAGNVQLDAQVERADEIGALSRSFNAMTAQLRDLIGSLERRVADRTRELERRSSYLEAAADVGRAAVSILDADELMQHVVEQIGDRFDLYYVGLFLVEGEGEWATLRANAGRTGHPLPQLGQRLAVGSSSMVGWSIANAQARVTLEAAEDAVRLAQPELPDTRSEAALPLRSRGQVLGALTVQHTEPGAFDQDTVVVLQTMADQVAVALDNARLFAEREQAMEATQRVYGELSERAWTELLQSKPTLGYRSDEHGMAEAGDVWRPEMEEAMRTGQTVQGSQVHANEVYPLAVPIKVRGQVIGVLDTYKPAGAGDWTQSEIGLLEAIATQLDSALESARLYQDTQRRVAREQAIRHVTEHMRRAVDIETILQNTVTELANALGAPRAYVRLGTELTPGAGDGQGDDTTVGDGTSVGDGTTVGDKATGS